jgi:hypothetical protein
MAKNQPSGGQKSTIKDPQQAVDDAIAILTEHLPAFVLIYTPDGEGMSVSTHGQGVAVRGLVGWFANDWEMPWQETDDEDDDE